MAFREQTRDFDLKELPMRASDMNVRKRASSLTRRAGLTARAGLCVFVAALTALLTGCPASPGPDGGDGNGGGGTGGGSADIIRGHTVFAIIGDYGDDDDNTRAVADLVKSWNPDFIITTGDNDYSDGAYKGTFTALEFSVGQYFHEFIGNYQGSEGPGATENRFFPTPGDHDWGDTCDDPTGLDDYLAYFTLPSENSGNERYYDFRRGDIHFFSIHAITDCEPDGTAVDSVQAQWVRATAEASNAPFKIAIFHKPAYSSGASHVGEGAHMRWPWADWGFDLTLSGDDHIYERIERDGIKYVVNGLGGLDLHSFVDAPVAGSTVRYAAEHGAMRADIFDGGVVLRFINVDGDIIDTFQLGTPDTGGGSTDGILDPNVPPVTDGTWYRPDVTATWQWQLQPGTSGEINTSYAVDVYDIDLFDNTAATIAAIQATGAKVICYFSAGSYEDFREDAGEFVSADLGNTLAGFADERWLDVRSSNVHRIMRARLDLAAQKGCDGVEPDNVDGYQNNPGFPLTETDQLAFNRFLANEAHDRGLSVALKNDLDQIPDLVDYFDSSVNEQCHEYSECETLLPFIDAGKPVFNAEYSDTYVSDSAARATMCAAALNLGLQTLVLPLDLDDSFRLSCGD